MDNPWISCVLHNWAGAAVLHVPPIAAGCGCSLSTSEIVSTVPPLFAQRLVFTSLHENPICILTGSHRPHIQATLLNLSRHRLTNVSWGQSSPCRWHGGRWLWGTPGTRSALGHPCPWVGSPKYTGSPHPGESAVGCRRKLSLDRVFKVQLTRDTPVG